MAVEIRIPIHAPNPTPRGPLLACAVILVSHDYGRFLPEAVASVFAQTLRAAEVLIIDDASSDGTPAIVEQLQQRYGAALQYLHIESRNTHQARRTGFEATRSPVVCFLDADDRLPADYLSAGLPAFADPRVGIVYSDMYKFGESEGMKQFEQPGQFNIQHQNRCHAGSLARRAALETSGAFDAHVSQESHADWFTWRRVTEAGWQLAKSPAVYQYRQHGASQSHTFRSERSPYYELAALENETITIFVPLSGREWAWPCLRDWLDGQAWPRNQTRLVLCDTSLDVEFSMHVNDWISRVDYPDIRYYVQPVGKPGLADADRLDDDNKAAVQAAMPQIYNRMAREVTTEYVLIVEDDILPPLDVAEKLLRGMDADVASVSALYPSRYKPGYVAWDRNGRPFEADGLRGAELLTIGGNGFGCVMLRRSVMQQTVFQHASPSGDYDPNFYHWLAGTRWRARLDCRQVCEHRSEPGGICQTSL